MQSSFSILSALHQIITPEVEISGKVIIGEEPMGDQNENICINTLANRAGYPQEGIANVNLHLMGLNEEKPNMERMIEILECVFPLLDGREYYLEADEITLHLEIDNDNGFFPDDRNKGKFFYNIRIQFLTF